MVQGLRCSCVGVGCQRADSCVRPSPATAAPRSWVCVCPAAVVKEVAVMRLLAGHPSAVKLHQVLRSIQSAASGGLCCCCCALWYSTCLLRLLDCSHQTALPPLVCRENLIGMRLKPCSNT